MKKLENFLPRILPWCLGAPEPLVFQALIDSASQFCEESTCVHYISDPITIIPGVAEYDIDLPEQSDLARVMKVFYADDAFDLIEAQPMNWRLSSLTTLRIYPTPQQALPEGKFMFIEVATKPARDAKLLDDRLYTDWIEGVVGGAIFRLCSIPDQPYTNPGNAAIGLRAFNMWRGKAQYECTKHRVKRNTQVVMRPWA